MAAHAPGRDLRPQLKTLTLTLLAWAALNVVWPMDWPMDPRLLALVNVVPQTVTVVLTVLALRRRVDEVAAEAAASPALKYSEGLRASP